MKKGDKVGWLRYKKAKKGTINITQHYGTILDMSKDGLCAEVKPQRGKPLLIPVEDMALKDKGPGQLTKLIYAAGAR